MADKSNIEWTDATWNPIRARNLNTGKIGWHCEHVTEACRFCYAEGMNQNTYFGNGLPYKPGLAMEAGGPAETFLDEATLLKPLHWKKPRKIFVCSMTDLFGRWVTDTWLDRIYAVMALCPQHTFIVLTKRPERMRAYLDAGFSKMGSPKRALHVEDAMWKQTAYKLGGPPDIVWPFPNVWAGTSCSTQEDADKFIPEVLATPLAKRIVSLEPLLGPIDLIGTLARYQDSPQKRDCAVPLGRQLIDWVIVGGESGKNARPMHPEWARFLRDQCNAAGVPFFFKQWGEYGPCELKPCGTAPLSVIAMNGKHLVGREAVVGFPEDDCAEIIGHFGKKAAGRLLDGVDHSEFPG